MWYSFQGSTLNVLLRDPLERIFSFFLSLSAIPRELIQHSDFLSTDRTGRYVLSAYYQGAHAAVHPVGHDGAVGGPPIEWVETAIGAHAIQTDPSNPLAFVPPIDNRGGPNAIFQFKFDPTTGHLTPNAPPRVDQPTRTGPRH